ncbi:hypothetical protein [Bo-Circo-like virus CH]|nr:hypothetical protein [Bo-Circo-like virus CH]
MFDPHRTRRSDKRYYTRKGQVRQASRVNTKPIIDQRLVPVYKNYLITNNLISPPPPPPSPQTKLTIDAVSTSSIAQPKPTNSFDYASTGGEISISSLSEPRIVITIKEQESDYYIIIYMIGNMTSWFVGPETYYAAIGLGGAVEYDIKFLSDGQSVISVQDQASGDIDNTTFLLPKSKYTITLPA